MRKLILWTAAFCTSLVVAASAEQARAPVVVELFTSQGCSSCPPADELLAQMAHRDDIIPLSLHVDYWDYLGWKDPFAQPKFTLRQKAYARSGGWRRIYTPQMVINGAAAVVGSKPMDVVDAIRAQEDKPNPVTVDLNRQGNTLLISAKARQNVGQSEIYVIRYEPSQVTKVRAGENAGRNLTYTNVVSSWERAARWNGRSGFQARVKVRGDDPIVVLVQQPKQGRILGAARLR
jgi:hypothetical protein